MQIRLLVGLWALGVSVGWCWGSEPVCYRTAAEAAEQTGVRGVAGYRLESERRDLYAGTRWVLVRSCEHPERPAVVVLVGTSALPGLFERPTAIPISIPIPTVTHAQPARVLVLQAGTRVRVVTDEGLVRVEQPGVALAGGAAGERVRVRLVSFSTEQPVERFVSGILSSSGVVVEVEKP